MRRWNGWGDENNDFALNEHGLAFLQQTLGKASALADASLNDVLAQVPESRVQAHELLSTDKELRLRHARGQSLPDWLAMRSGDFGLFPDAVAQPQSAEEICALMALAQEQDYVLIPYGGGTSVVGHVNPTVSQRPLVTVSLAKINQLSDLDADSRIATFGAGVAGPDLEAQLAARGYTLGHFPQSFELSTLGGWVASRSSGQQSLRYGRIEQLFAGGKVETFKGTLDIPDLPASSAGPDLREMLMGSEGRMGIISEVKVRVRPIAEKESFHAVFLPDWDAAVHCARQLVQDEVKLSMLRVSNPVETFTQLVLAGHPKLIAGMEKLLSLRSVGDGKCMLMLGVTGSRKHCQHALQQAKRVVSQHKGVYVGTLLGKKWEHSRFRSPYLRHGLWSHGYAVDTFETSINWPYVPAMVERAEAAIKEQAKAYGVHVFTHLSHMYQQGSSIYTTYIFPVAETYEATFERWQGLKRASAEAIVELGGTISHQHGVGVDHAPYLAAEKGDLGIDSLRALMQHFDPQQRLNPGKLLPESD